jgi:hypothetical protein
LSFFLEKVFDIDFLQKYFNGVFELPLPRNAQKRTKKKSQEKKAGCRMAGGWVRGLANVRGIFLPAPRSVGLALVSARRAGTATAIGCDPFDLI